MKLEKTKPIFIEKIWGGRRLKNLFGKALPAGKKIGESWELYNKKMPVVVKLLDVKEPLSIQVHPEGKSEFWYVIEAGKDAKSLSGINLQAHKIVKGMWVYVPNGTVHTIFPPAVLLEISQAKLITYRLYDWGRKRGKLDLEEGLKAINPDSNIKISRNISSFKCRYFKIVKMKVNKKGFYNKNDGVFFVLDGKIQIRESVFKKGDTVLVPSGSLIKGLPISTLFKISP